LPANIAPISDTVIPPINQCDDCLSLSQGLRKQCNEVNVINAIRCRHIGQKLELTVPFTHSQSQPLPPNCSEFQDSRPNSLRRVVASLVVPTTVLCARHTLLHASQAMFHWQIAAGKLDSQEGRKRRNSGCLAKATRQIRGLLSQLGSTHVQVELENLRQNQRQTMKMESWKTEGWNDQTEGKKS
jgi:hypothetical protein